MHQQNLTLNHFPTAHFKYTSDIKMLFDRSPENFIGQLKSHRPYLPAVVAIMSIKQ